MEGTRNLVRAAERTGARRFIAQSISFTYEPTGDSVKDEEAPLWLDVPGPYQRTINAVVDLEHQVGSAASMEGVVIQDRENA